MRRLLVLVTVLAVTAACGGGGVPEGPAVPGAGAGEPAEEVVAPPDAVVALDPRTDDPNVEWLGYFPSRVEVHPGDDVEFDLEDSSGMPHTVTLGTLIDEALSRSATSNPGAPPATAEELLADLQIPSPFPQGELQGTPRLNQSAAQPCYLNRGTPPFSTVGGAPACPTEKQPEFDGTQAFYSSGLLADSGDAFVVELSDRIKPGTYHVMCLVHRQRMSAQIAVVPREQRTPSAEAVREAGERQRDGLLQKLRPVVDRARQSPSETDEARQPPPAVTAGVLDPAVPAVVAEFAPKAVSVPVGGTVTWNVSGVHTIAFNARDGDAGLVEKAGDGSWSMRPEAAGSVGFDPPPAAATLPPQPRPVVVDGGGWDGAGFRNTGLLASLPPQPVTVKQSFSRGGTYVVRCLVHPDMKGQVTVG